MDDSKELVVLETTSENSSLASSLTRHGRQGLPEWKKYGFSSQAGCEFGSIQFFKGSQKYNRNSKFMIVDPRETPGVLLRVLLEKWKLVLPKLLIHLVGEGRQTAAEYDKSLGRIFSKGLIQAIRHTDVWLLTDGLHHGITASVGKVLADSASEIAMVTQRHLVAIGMTSASITGQMQTLQQSLGGPVEYQLESSCHDANETCLLDPSHTHFIVVEDRGQYNADVMAPLREGLIDNIALCKIRDSNANVPVVYVLFGGDEDSVQTIYSAVVERNIPVIIVAGSGGMADLLAAAIGQPKEASSYRLTGELDNSLKMKEIMSQSYAHLVTVLKEDQKMDEAVLLALMNANRGTQGQNELLLAVIWNRVDLARKELTMNKNWIEQFQEAQLAESLQYALLHGHHKFVELFLERDCIDLKKFLTKDCLLDLYHQVGTQTLLRKLLSDEKKQQAKDFSSKPDLEDVGNILKQLIALSNFSPACLTDNTQEGFASSDQELFIWAVLLNQRKMALVLWKYSGMSIGGALLASKLLKAMSSLVKEPEVSLDMFQHSREFQERAIGVLNRCYAENQYNTSLLLTRVLPECGEVTCLDLAFAAKNKQFIGQPAVQSLLKKLWMGRLSSETHPVMIWICTFLPFAAMVLMKFTSVDNLSKPAISSNVYPVSENLDSSYIDEADCQYRSLHGGFLPSLKEYTPQTSRIAWWYKFKLFIEAPIISFRYHLALVCFAKIAWPGGPSFRKLLVIFLVALFRGAFYFHKQCTQPTLYAIVKTRTPIWTNQNISHLLFLSLFSYILLKEFRPHQQPLEMILMAWVFTLFAEEFRELLQEDYESLRDRFEAWLWGYWNLVDLVSLLMFGVGMALRYTEDLLDEARIVLALDLIVFYLRLLQFFSANKFLGPKLIMIVKMMMDIITFICILFVFLVAYGVAFQSILYPNEEDSLTVVRGVLYQPYFQMYGELFLKDLHRDECEHVSTEMTTPASIPIVCPQNSWFGTIVLAFYLFISNIMLLNLLIAMLNYTFAMVQENTDTYWKFQRFELVKEYRKRPVLAPPFIIIVHIYRLVRTLWKYCIPQKIQENSSSAMRKYIKDEQIYSDLSLWESIKAKEFLAAMEKQHNRDKLHRMKQTDERLEKISTDGEALARDLNHRLDSLQTQVDLRLSSVETQMAELRHLLQNLCDRQLPTST